MLSKENRLARSLFNFLKKMKKCENEETKIIENSAPSTKTDHQRNAKLRMAKGLSLKNFHWNPCEVIETPSLRFQISAIYCDRFYDKQTFIMPTEGDFCFKISAALC